MLQVLENWQLKWRNKIKEFGIENRIETLIPRFSLQSQGLAQQLLERWRGLPLDYEIPRIDPVSHSALVDVALCLIYVKCVSRLAHSTYPTDQEFVVSSNCGGRYRLGASVEGRVATHRICIGACGASKLSVKACGSCCRHGQPIEDVYA